MDDSQSSDIFSENSISLQNVTINAESYDLLLNKIKNSTIGSASQRNQLPECFNLILNDCNSLIFQGIELILSLLEESAVPIDKVINYIDDGACTLQILSNFIKNVIETTAVTCCTMKTFPTCTGNIISLVFSHCKDSECIYGRYLHDVEKKLKDLFRNCHELQLTYLMALGKNFLFDLSEQEEQEILLETLDINLKIGEVVQALDVKTMAEQWKAYVMICEKYSNFLLDKSIYNNCTKLLASTIQDNIRSALQVTEDKIVMRSLKVANFSLKILLKISSIFKGAICVNYQHILDLLQHISLCNSNYHELTFNKSPGFSKLMYTNLTAPTDALINQLVNEEKFIKLVLSTNIKDENILAYILFRISIMKALLKTSDVSGTKYKLIECVLFILPKCHVCFNMGLKFNSIMNENNKSYGLYEYLLIHTLAIAACITRQEYIKLEKRFYEAIMGFDYYTAVFCSNVWISLCRMNNSQLQINTLQNLLKIYQKLETNGSFATSPQQVNLNYTIELFFQALKYPEKLLIYKHFSIQDKRNIGIWFALKIRNLPENLEINAERLVIEKLIKVHDESSNNNASYDNLVVVSYLVHISHMYFFQIKYMKLASTCSFVECYLKLEDLIVMCWSRCCPDCSSIVLQNHPKVFRYMECLTYLTESYVQNFENNTSLIKIINVMSSIMLKGNPDLIVLILKTFCKLLCQCEDEDDSAMNLLINTLQSITKDSYVQNCLFSMMTSHEDINNLFTPILNKHPSLTDLKQHFVEYKTRFQNNIDRKELLEIVSENIFVHKCINDNNADLKVDAIKTSSNFDIDIDSLFEESEPASKKAKIDIDIENLVSNIENNVSQLSQAKENILNDHKNRIKNVCDNLRNIIS
ncbi:uncharacterized protein C1orf112 homolog [Vanessa cardui]|uniref:uncharacterized protein C1orf112 homolog n=1 Tax=Vanessa cardui TaxID=171605 RepID=UPI001F12FEFC|nr:uncharacterized protein C1orf112 homolog [Vanessa cardui]